LESILIDHTLDTRQVAAEARTDHREDDQEGADICISMQALWLLSAPLYHTRILSE
jgi:hypothetical protein